MTKNEEWIERKKADNFKKEWKNLTYDEINDMQLPESGTATIIDFVRIIEAKLKEKNY